MSAEQRILHPVPFADPHDARLLVDSVTDYAIYMLDPSGLIVSWNTGAQRIKQYSATEVVGRHFSMFYTDEDIVRLEPERVLDVARREGSCRATGWRLRKDGSRFLADVTVAAVHDQNGVLTGFAKVTRDMSTNMQAEQKIREATMLKALVNTAVDGVMMIDAEGRIQMANPACESLFGYPLKDMIGLNVRSLILTPVPLSRGENTYVPNERRSGVRRIVGSGHEVVGRRKDGGTFPMCLSIGEAQENGCSTFIGIMHDLTDRKRTEEQLVQAQKMETVGQLSGGIAHDFNNLLTVIIGNADLMIEGIGNRPELRQLCDTILAAGERGAELTRRLLAFSRRQTLQPAIINCGKLVENMQLMLRRTLSEDIDIRVSSEPLLLSAYADPAQLESAVLNLALNARDAMPKGGHITVNVSNAVLDEEYQHDHPEVKPGDYVMICVTDDGEGMTPEVRDHVFEPFFTTKEVGKGSGLGLSMIYGFVKQSNGHVTIYSEPGLGTTVRLYLPAAANTRTIAEQAKTVVDLSALRGKETVLVAEDDPFVRSHAVASLESFGYKVITATDGREALARLAEGVPVDILFSDVVMPNGFSGWELAEQARKSRPGLKVLLTSGYPMETLTARHRHNPDLALLNKPYRKIELGQRLRKVLDAEAGQPEAAASST